MSHYIQDLHDDYREYSKGVLEADFDPVTFRGYLSDGIDNNFDQKFAENADKVMNFINAVDAIKQAVIDNIEDFNPQYIGCKFDVLKKLMEA